MDAEKVLRDLIGAAYEAATDRCQWPAFLSSFARAVQSPSAALVVQDLCNPRGSASESLGFDPFWEGRYLEYYGKINVWMHRARELFQPGEVSQSNHIVGDEELVRTEFYNDFLRPQNHFYSFGSVLTERAAVISFITAMRSRSAGPFGEREVALLRELVPHLQSALRVHGRMASLESRLSGLTSALDHIAQGVMLIDAAGRVRFMNRYAEEMLRAADGLKLLQGVIHAVRPDQTGNLHRLIASAIAGRGGGMSPGGLMTVARARGRRGFHVMVAPHASEQARANGAGVAIVFVTDPERAPDPKVRVLEQLLQLTTAEARLAKSLAGGKTLQSFAEEAGVSLNTARSHLKQIFAKTGVSRQADLVRIVLSATPPDANRNSDHQR